MNALFDELPKQVSVERQIEAVEREIKFRRYVYPKRVAAQKMTQQKANDEIAYMEAVRATLADHGAAVDLLRSIIAANDDYLEANRNARREPDPLTLACDRARKFLEGKPG